MSDATNRWDVLEAWLRSAFEGRVRKNGQPMVDHSLRIGRALAAAGADEVTVFGGYCHDVLEDVEEVGVDNLQAVAEAILGEGPDADAAVVLVQDCSYSEEEYALPKPERKKAAVARWLASPDPRVHMVKRFDVEDNRADCASVSAAFEAEYMSWAGPLHEGLCGLIEAARGAPRP